MILDLDSKTVAFFDEELTLAQLWSLIELMDDEVDTDEDVLAKLHPEPKLIFPVYMRHITPESNYNGRYCVVQLQNGHWLCSCADFYFRRKDNGDVCKHILDIIGWMG